MGKIIYLMNLSLDGFIEGPDGNFAWSRPDEEVHRFHNQQARSVSAFLYGRGMYETMKVWQTMDEAPDIDEYLAEFSRFWRDTPKVVFSSSLDEVVPNTRLISALRPETVEQLRQEFSGDLAVSGAALAASFAALDLIDEYRLVLSPVLVGGGKTYFPQHQQQHALKLLDTQTFSSGTVYLRYGRDRS